MPTMDGDSEPENGALKVKDSNEQFEMFDFFTLSFVHVRGAPVGSCKRKTYLPGNQAWTHLKGSKRCVLRVPQDDNTPCCP